MFYEPFRNIEPESAQCRRAISTFVADIVTNKPGGIIVRGVEFDTNPGQAVGKDENGDFRVIPCSRCKGTQEQGGLIRIFVEDSTAFKPGDVICGQGMQAVKVIEVSRPILNECGRILVENMQDKPKYNTILYKANPADEGKTDARPLYTPEFVTIAPMYGREGDNAVAVTNCATFRSGNVCLPDEIVKEMNGIFLV